MNEYTLSSLTDDEELNFAEEAEVFVFPTSFAQQRLWFLDQLAPGNPFYNVSAALRLTGSLNLTALKQTFNEIVRRHETLRTTFIMLEQQPVQAIAPSLSIPLPLLDLRKFDSQERKTQARQIATQEAQAATFEIWGALLNGAQLVGVSKDVTLSPRRFVSQLREKDINVVFLTTALFQLIVRDIPEAFASLKYLLFGGETVNTRWIKKILKHGAPKHLIHVYGPTENTTFSSYYYVEELPESATSFPIGRPITNTQIYILDTHLQPVPIGVTGELYLGGDGLAREYLRRTELTAKHFVSNPFSNNPKARLYKTGDLARYRPDGNIEFLGRVDNQVKIRGFRIELSEIEAVLSQHPAVKETVVIASEDVPDDKYLVAYIVPHQEQISTQEAQNFASSLREFGKEKLPEYMLPKAYVVLESLPLTPNGKVDRRALPMPDTISFNNQDYVAPRSQVEELLTEIWAKVLGKEQVGVHNNFFELGGHSLLATRLTSRIRETFQIDLSVRNLFETPTVEQLAKYIDTIRWVAKDVNRIETTEIQREDVEF